MRTRATTIAVLTAGLLLTACSSGSDSKASSGTQDATAAFAIIHAAVPTSTLTLTVTEANDGNHLLGRPHQYTSALKFTDSRIKASDIDIYKKGDIELGGGIEVFANHDDAQARADYIQAVTKSLPALSEYDYVQGATVVRVSHFLTPTQAASYKTAASKLG